MPYILCPLITESSPGMWFEGQAYSKKNIYNIEDGKLPPVNYDEHIVRPHSLTHVETEAHTRKNGKTVDYYYSNHKEMFHGPTAVIKLRGNNYKLVDSEKNISHWVITKSEIEEGLKRLNIVSGLAKILISTEYYPKNEHGYHDPDYVLTLSQEAADLLVSYDCFHLYGTSWKSSDYMPGSMSRPIHTTLFSKGIILENLDLEFVPEGIYFMAAYPLPLKNASESPVVPVLFKKEEFEHFI